MHNTVWHLSYQLTVQLPSLRSSNNCSHNYFLTENSQPWIVALKNNYMLTTFWWELLLTEPSQHISPSPAIPVTVWTQSSKTFDFFYSFFSPLNLHTQPFNGPFSRTTRVGRYQKGKTYLDLTEARDGEWVAVASAGPYASLHHAPDRQPRQHPTTRFL